MNTRQSIVGLCIVLLMIASASSHARGFRGFSNIATPQQNNLNASRGQRQQAPASSRPVSRLAGEAAVKRLVQAWNGGQMDKVVGEQFFDKTQLLDAMASDVPRDARLRLVSVRSVQTLGQHVENDPNYGQVLVSQISATARTQVEFNDPNNGALVNRPGENEFILVVRQRMPR